MYGRLKERKIKQTDYNFSCQETRKELDEYIDSQSKRVNIDSAKKLAVMQHMDYEGFRQMVLGANIFPTKSKQLILFSQGEGPAGSLNSNKLYDQTKTKEDVKKEVQMRLKREVEGKSEFHCYNFRDFKKKFMKNYSKQLNQESAEICYRLTKEQNSQRIAKIFNIECEANILPKIIEVFCFIQKYLGSQENEDTLCQQTGFMIKFIEAIVKLQNMQEMNLSILTKKQRTKILDFLAEAQKIIKEDEKSQDQTCISSTIKLLAK